MSTLHLSRQAARHLHLSAQGLLNPPRRRATRADVLACIRRMALLQIDTINVVARSPYLVLFSRLGHYQPAWLDELLAEGALFEYWAHEACFIPIEDYGLLRHRMLDATSLGWKCPKDWLARHGTEIEALLSRMRQQGPLRSADFARQHGTGSGWWDWKPEKRHLEVLFAQGRVMVRARHNFQRIYDLAERVLPQWNDARDLPTPEQARQTMLQQSCRALGIIRAGWLSDYYRIKGGRHEALLHHWADQGELIPVRVEGWQQDAFVHASLAPELARAEAGSLKAGATAVLSPFDPVVWDRKRARELFDFDYRIECYTPAARRQYGYFALPILHRGKLIGRLDAKAHRQQGIFEIRRFHLEPGVRVSQRLLKDLGQTLHKLADWHGTPQIRMTHGPDGLIAPRGDDTA
ncbi:winged helix-turn-helix domain-containing protein [Paludibacterium sp. B53371]|uniref:winged helix-turn-helix domain-containing protein n=1 Tax=Paludibacterium sp. B53371 TaxID=2806263 RepID=UPI001C03C9BE|nr:winged helix-turn-helix domain-containing protein [Paludibacterium sp. B53371]